MRALGVVEHEPVVEFPVEEGEIGEEEILRIVHEGLLQGAVEALGVGVHLGALGVGVPASDTLFGQDQGKAHFELTTVVGEHDFGGLGQAAQSQVPCCTGMTGLLGGARPGEGYAARRATARSRPAIPIWP